MNRPATALFAIAFATMSVGAVFLNMALSEARKTIAHQTTTIAIQQAEISLLKSQNR